MTAEPKKKSKSLVLIIAGGLVLLCIVCGVFGAILGSTPEAKATSTARAIERATEAAKPTATPGPANTPLPTNTPPLPAPPFEEIRSTVAGMTEAQWKAYLPTLEGMVVEQWTGWVAEVNVKGSQYELWVDMDAPDDLLSAQDIYFPIPADIAMQLQKDQKITFSGQIERVSEFLGSISIYLENVTLEGQDFPQTTPETADISNGIAPSYEEIRSKVESMTEAQWKAYLPTLEGLLVENWTGWIAEVNVKGSQYELWVDMDSPDVLFSTQDIYFPIPNDIALELQMDERITFSGRIKSVTELLGSVSFHLEEVTLEPTSEPTEAPTDTPEPQTIYLGDVVENFGYSLSASTVEDPATSPGYFYEPEEGKKLVAVEFIVGNVSGETFSSNVLYAVLVDTEGFTYGADSGAVENSLELLDLNPGEKVRGWAGFIVPQDTTPASLKYAIRGSSSEVLQVGLAQPEETQVQREPEPTYTPNPDLPKLGDVVENFGYSLSASTVEDPATSPGYFYEPEEGKKLVAVEFIVGNVSGETFSSNVLYAVLVDTEGFTYGADSGAVENSLELLDLNPGEKVRGWAGFIVPQDTTPASLKYAIRGSSSEVLQVGLTTE